MCGVALYSMAGRTIRFPQLVECSNIPQDKREIVILEMARHFSHIKEVAKEIPPYHPKVKVEILIGRDAPELFKVRENKNGQKGAPWVQRLDLGWISGQMCLDQVGGLIHISAPCTAVEYPNKTPCPLPLPWDAQTIHCSSTIKYEVVPCLDHFKVKEKYTEKEEMGAEIFRTTPEDILSKMTDASCRL